MHAMFVIQNIRCLKNNELIQWNYIFWLYHFSLKKNCSIIWSTFIPPCHKKYMCGPCFTNTNTNTTLQQAVGAICCNGFRNAGKHNHHNFEIQSVEADGRTRGDMATSHLWITNNYQNGENTITIINNDHQLCFRLKRIIFDHV